MVSDTASGSEPPAGTAATDTSPVATALPPVAMVLAAGFGTRLRPLTEAVPKPLVPIGDRPVLAHVAASLARAGVERLVVNSHHGAAAFGQLETQPLPLPSTLVHEPTILGTAGGVRHAAAALGDGDVLVYNGDILAEIDFAGLARAHRRSGALATLAVCGRPRAAGTVGLGANDRVVRLRDERYGSELRAVDFVGIQLLSPELRRRLPAPGCLVADGYQPALRAGETLAVAEVVRSWQDIGSLAAYLGANVDWLRRYGRAAWVAPGAQVSSSVELDAAVVGPGAEVVGVGRLCRVVVWPGAVVRAPLADAVVVPPSRVVPVVGPW